MPLWESLVLLNLYKGRHPVLGRTSTPALPQMGEGVFIPLPIW